MLPNKCLSVLSFKWLSEGQLTNYDVCYVWRIILKLTFTCRSAHYIYLQISGLRIWNNLTKQKLNVKIN